LRSQKHATSAWKSRSLPLWRIRIAFADRVTPAPVARLEGYRLPDWGHLAGRSSVPRTSLTPILRFADSPRVTLINVHPGKYTLVTPGDKSVDVSEGNTRAAAQGWNLSGSGEPPTVGIGGAVANAFFDATGVRLRQAPMTPGLVRGVLRAAGK